jgi:hypothetical protein
MMTSAWAGSSLLTPSFLSRSRAPCRKSRDTSSFSSSHWMTKGSNHLEQTQILALPCPGYVQYQLVLGPSPGCRWTSLDGSSPAPLPQGLHGCPGVVVRVRPRLWELWSR